MDATKLIEEAGQLTTEEFASGATNGPWRVDDLVVIMAGEEAVAECFSFKDARFIARARTLVPELAAALKASEERAKERDALAAANLAANKRIVELEHERDSARAELARLTTPRPIADAPRTAGLQIIALWMDDDVVESMDVVCWADMDDGDHPERKFWMNTAGEVVEHMTHYLPLPEVKP